MRVQIGSLVCALFAAAGVAPATAQNPADEPPEWDKALVERMRQSYRRRDLVDIVDRMLEEIAEEPALVPVLDEVTLWRVLFALEEADELEAERRLLTVMIDGGWEPDDELTPRPNFYDARLALRHIEAGDPAAAAAVLARVEWRAVSLISILSDKRYEPVWAAIEATPGGNVVAAAENDVRLMERVQSEYPDRLEPIRLTMGALRRAGRPEEAAQTGAATLAAVTDGQVVPLDGAIEITWLLTELAAALSELGDMAQAHAVMAAAAAQPEVIQQYGRTRPYRLDNNVSHSLAAAQMLIMDGRPQEGLAAIEALRAYDLSEYGQAYEMALRACAGVQLPDQRMVEDALWRLAGWEDQFPEIAELGYLCGDEHDDAVELMIWRLEDEGDYDEFETESEDRRLDALYELQHLRTPAHVPAFQAVVNARQDRLRADPRVLAAAEPYGRILSWELTR